MVKKKKTNNVKSIIKTLIIIIFLLVTIIFSIQYVKSNYDNSGFKANNYSMEDDNVNLLILVNKDNPLPDNYRTNLVSFKGHEVSRVIYNDLTEMFEAAKNDKVNLYINTSYRSRKQQQEIWDSTIVDFMNQGLSRKNAIKNTEKTVLKPGYSEHETGLSIDFSKPGAYNVNSEMWNWLNTNAHKYGFILRYPETKKTLTKIDYEPWHYRYVGKDYSEKIKSSGLCLEEYLDKEI